MVRRYSSIIAFAAIALLTYGAVTPKGRLEPFEEAAAEQLEAQVRALTEQLGAPETSARRTGRTEAVSTPTSTAAESSDDHEVEAVG